MTIFRVSARAADRVEVDVAGRGYPMSPDGRPGWWGADVPGAIGRLERTIRSGWTAASRWPTRARRGSRRVRRAGAGPMITRLRLDGPALAGRAGGRRGHLRAAHRHVHPGRDAQRRDRAA